MIDLERTLVRYFEVKTSADVEGTMAFFARDLVCYVDATLGWDLPGYEALQAVFEQYMPNWDPPARSYATSVLANDVSALVRMTDTPELFGGELRILAAIDFDDDGLITRWVDYWDGGTFDPELYAQMRTPVDMFPSDLGDGRVPTRGDARLVEVATELQRAWAAADAADAACLLHTDVVVDDMPLRTQVIGRIEASRYLDRVLGRAPYGRGSRLRHVVGGPDGGGFEWTAGADAGALAGITAVELDTDGLITHLTTVFDSAQLDPAHKTELVLASIP
jgi:hypothetical protein